MGQIHSLLDRFGVEEMRRLASLEDKTQRLCVEAAHEVMSDEDQAIGIAHAGFAMAALPHKKISESIWRREGGSIQLLVESGLDKENKAVGVPFGAMARLILLYLQTQAVRTRSRSRARIQHECLVKSNGCFSWWQNLYCRQRSS